MYYHDGKPFPQRNNYTTYGTRNQSKTYVVREANAAVKKSFAPSGKRNAKETALKEFFSFTSLPGVSQYGRQDHIGGRVFWLLAFFGGLSLGFYQSWGLIDDYFKYKTYQQTVTHVNTTLAWPAVTICNKSPIRWKDVEEEGVIDTALMSLFEEEVAKSVEPVPKVKRRYIKEMVLLSLMRKLWVEDGLSREMLSRLNEVIIVCLWNYVQKCNIVTDFIEFYTVYYGNCFTFNSGLLPGVEDINVYPASGLTIAAYLDTTQEVPFLARNTGLVMVFHEPGTAPIFNQASCKHMQPGQWMKVALKVANYKRLPAPYPSKCVGDDDNDLQKQSVYYSEKRPYRYSFEACTASCIQNKVYKYCNCTDQKIPWKKEDAKICIFINQCVQNNSKFDPEMCHCPFTCKENVYTTQITYEYNLIEYPYWQEAATEMFKPVLKFLPNGTEITKELLRSSIAVAEIFFASVLYDETVEFAKYSVADFWGAIGGNIGFWTGISVLSLVELLELVYLGLWNPRRKQSTVTTRK